jgi:hypothetical protein
MKTYQWHRSTIAESFDRLTRGEKPWVAFGDFLDDWRRSGHEDRYELIEVPLQDTARHPQWAALFAATVEQLCSLEQINSPAWIRDETYYYLPEPWYPTVRSEKMGQLYQEITPLIFKQHNVFSGDRVLDRI